MKKILFLVAMAMMTMTSTFAQKVAKVNGTRLDIQDRPLLTSSADNALPMRMLTKTPSVNALGENQQYMGAYTSETYCYYYYGLQSTPGTWSPMAFLPTESFSAYDGGKVVGMRIGLYQALSNVKVFVAGVTETTTSLKLDTLATGVISSAAKGWNNVTFDTPATLDLSKYDFIGLGYTYVQTSSNTPIGIVPEGITCSTMFWGTYNSKTTWWDTGISDYGNLAVQAIVEKEFAKVGVSAYDFDDCYVKIGETANAELYLTNLGIDGVSSIGYTITRNGVTSEEKTLQLTTKVTDFNGVFSVKIPFEAAAEAQTDEVKITITKVNGVDNPQTGNVSRGKVITVSKLFTHNVAVEEFTGTGCGYCPRGWVGMENLRKTFGDNFVGIAIHQYSNSSRDAMNIATSKYAALSFSGAPSCMIERGEEIDPYYGSDEDICDDFKAAQAEVAPVGVEVSGTFSEDKNTVEAKAVVESLVDGNAYDIEYVLIADSLSGTTTQWKQANYYSSYTTSQAGVNSDMAIFCKGGEYATSTVALTFNDVAIASSYVNSVNTAITLGTLNANIPVENTCTVAMPTYANLVQALHYDKIYVAALVVNKSTGKIVNAAKSRVTGGESAINNVNADATATAKNCKAVLNGRLVILNGAKQYTISGAQIK